MIIWTRMVTNDNVDENGNYNVDEDDNDDKSEEREVET